LLLSARLSDSINPSNFIIFLVVAETNKQLSWPSSSCADMAKGKRQRRNTDDESTESTGLVGMLEAET
jgi:hypothetical protein